MEVFQIYYFLIFSAISGFLLFEEYRFKKSLIKIKGKVVGFSKGKSLKNKNRFYPVIEFVHPNGQKGWLDHYSSLVYLHKLNKDVTLLADENDFYVVRPERSASFQWGVVFGACAFLSLFAFLQSIGNEWPLVIAGVLILFGLTYFYRDKILKELDDDYFFVSAWREWRRLLVINKVYSVSNVGSIQFWSHDSYISFARRANRAKSIKSVLVVLYCSAFFYLAVDSYLQVSKFDLRCKKATATVVKIHNGSPVYEYYDLEGQAHIWKSHRKNLPFKSGDRVDVLYSPDDFKLLKFDNGSFNYAETLFMAALAFLNSLFYWLLMRRMPSIDLEKSPITNASELSLEQAG